MEQKYKNLNISKYSLKKNKDGKITQGDWQEGASEMIEVAVAKYTGSLLVGEMAVIGLMYKNGNMYEIYGPREDAMFHAVEKIKAKKRGAEEFHQKFMTEWNKAVPYMPGTLKRKITEINENKLLGTTLKARGYNAPKFAAEVGRTKQSIYGQISGEKGISKETAIEYGKILNVDPVDLLFEKKTTSIWGTVNTLKYTLTDESYAPCQIFASSEQSVVVPRDIAAPNIRAIKVDARGSMYHNQVMFYYKDNAADLEINNKLCVVGIKTKGFMDEELNHYYFGFYENYQGQNNLLNPDPYAKPDEKIILKNFDLDFISPIVATIDPKAVKDNTDAQQFVPEEVSITQQKHDQQLQVLQQEYERKIAKLEKEKQADFEKGQKLLEEYNNAQKNLDKELQKIYKAIEVKHYGNDQRRTRIFGDKLRTQARIQREKEISDLEETLKRA